MKELRPAKVVMIQGTGSSVGKSFIVTGLCRLFAQDGYRVAPFKAQNMSLNSAVTPAGLEIGRAQAVQAEAAGVEPEVEMNPVLLKPEGNRTSQLVVMGKMRGKLQAMDFLTRKRRLWTVVADALDSLRQRYDIIVVEGAGSPAEINLRSGDIVNMAIALHANAPVFLVGDIDKGGVFASLYGTVELVAKCERELVKGFIINKFRGDVELLRPGLDMIEDLTSIPVAGVLPYLTDVYVPEEDSPRMARVSDQDVLGGTIDVAILALPHMANFDEFDPLARRDGVRLRYVRQASELGRPDLVIIPGSKTTVDDLVALRQSGLEEGVRRHLADERPLIGVCGGMQMLGSSIHDPEGVESDQPVVDGMGILDIDTHFMGDKMTTQTRGTVVGGAGLLEGATGLPFSGYEIHVGISGSQGHAKPALSPDDGGPPVGFTDDSGRVLGTYVHDLFKNDTVVDNILRNVASMRGLAGHYETTDFSQDAEYNRLSSYIREYLDVGLLYSSMGIE